MHVALRVSGDRAAFYSCRILSHQYTLLDDAGRHYYKNCYIEGSVNFICGNAASLFERCHLHSLAEGNGSVTAQHRDSPLENTGLIFLGRKITRVGTTLLGRPWGAYSRVGFAPTYMSNVILPEGWNDWGDNQAAACSWSAGPARLLVQACRWSADCWSVGVLVHCKLKLLCSLLVLDA